MAVENLQELASEVVSKGASIDGMQYLYISLVSLVSAAAGSYFGAYFKKRGEEKAIKGSFDDVKLRLEQTTKISEEIKSKVGIDSIEHQIRFGRLHEKRIEVIEGFYHRLVGMEVTGREFVCLSSPHHKIGKQFETARDSIDEFLSYAKLNQFWVDKELFEEIKQLALSIDRIVHESVFHCDISSERPDDYVKAIQERQKAVDRISNEIPAAKEVLINSIRKVLDPSEN